MHITSLCTRGFVWNVGAAPGAKIVTLNLAIAKIYTVFVPLALSSSTSGHGPSSCGINFICYTLVADLTSLTGSSNCVGCPSSTRRTNALVGIIVASFDRRRVVLSIRPIITRNSVCRSNPLNLQMIRIISRETTCSHISPLKEMELKLCPVSFGELEPGSICRSSKSTWSVFSRNRIDIGALFSSIKWLCCHELGFSSKGSTRFCGVSGLHCNVLPFDIAVS